MTESGTAANGLKIMHEQDLRALPDYVVRWRRSVLWSKLRDFPISVGSGLLHEARAKLARQTVQSERPGHTVVAFAFCGVRTAFCNKGLRARMSLRVG